MYPMFPNSCNKMKQRIIILNFTFLNLLISAICYSQVTDNLTPYERLEINVDRANQSQLGLYLGPVTYQNMSYVSSRFIKFLNDKYGLNEHDSKWDMKADPKYMEYEYTKTIQVGGANNNFLKIRYNIFSYGIWAYVRSCKIYGSWDFVVSFFVDYWPIDFVVNKKSEKVEFLYFYMEDDIIMKMDILKDYAEINIKSRQYKSDSVFIKMIEEYNATH